MKLPSLKVSIPAIFLFWCIAGVIVHGPVMLAYPAMWAVVGLFFWGVHLLLRTPTAVQEIVESEQTSTSNSIQSPDTAAEPRTPDRKISAVH